MSIRPAKLPRAPLQEVIFQVLWEMTTDAQGRLFDPGFEFGQGIFKSLAATEFPVYKRTLPENSPVSVYPAPVHQFWRGEGHWPLVQLGPGILTVNDTERNYEWLQSFRPLVAQVLAWMQKSYEVPLRVIQLNLRYIDAVVIREADPSDVLAFINRNFRVNLKNTFAQASAPRHVNIGQVFAQADGNQLSITISDGTNASGQPAIIWQTAVNRQFEEVQFLSLDDVIAWAEQAHQLTHETFINIVTEDFYDTFR